jgi:HlyD family secretion protein
MKKSHKIAIAGLLAVGAGFVSWQIAGPQMAGAKAPVMQTEIRAAAVTVAPARLGPVVETSMVTGTLVARSEVLVGPEIEGLRIIELLAEEGDYVEKGAVLVRLSRETIDAQMAQSDAELARSDAAIAQAKSQISQAEASASFAEADFTRSQTLLKTGSSTQALVDQKQSSVRVARAQLQAAIDFERAAEAQRKSVEAQRRELQVRLSRTQVRTPEAGIVSRRNARLGAVALSVGEPMFRIIANGEIELEAEAPEARLGAIKPGLGAVVILADGERTQGSVRLVSPEVDRATRLGRVRITLTKTQSARVGAFARGEIEIRRSQALLVPASAINYSAEGANVLIAQGGVVHKRSITLGVVDNGSAEIREGLIEGDDVIVRAGAFLRDGDAIAPVRQARKQAEQR